MEIITTTHNSLKLSQCTVAFYGAQNCGKSSLIHRVGNGNFSENYIKTLHTKTTTIPFATNRKSVKMNCIEVSLVEEIPSGIDGIVVIFDMTSILSRNNAIFTLGELQQKFPNTHILLCANKYDKASYRFDRTQSIFLAKFVKKSGVKCYKTSAKSCYNFDKPFLYMLKQKFGQDTDLSMI
jgi:GTP-binding nuclear protein Ran